MKIAITHPTNKVHVATCGHLSKHQGEVKYATGRRAQAKIAQALELDFNSKGLTVCGNCRKALEAELAGR